MKKRASPWVGDALFVVIPSYSTGRVGSGSVIVLLVVIYVVKTLYDLIII
jgi:hypothetical protein